MFLSRRACVQRQTFANSRRPTERRRQCPNFSSAAPRSNSRKKPKNSVFDFDFSASSTQDGNSSEHIGCSVHTNGCAILNDSQNAVSRATVSVASVRSSKRCFRGLFRESSTDVFEEAFVGDILSPPGFRERPTFWTFWRPSFGCVKSSQTDFGKYIIAYTLFSTCGDLQHTCVCDR